MESPTVLRSFMSSPLSTTPYSSLDDLGKLDQVERVDVELLEGRLPGDLVGVGAEAGERLDDAGLDLICGNCCH